MTLHYLQCLEDLDNLLLPRMNIKIVDATNFSYQNFSLKKLNQSNDEIKVDFLLLGCLKTLK